MTGLVLANVDYQRHMTDEGHQLQEGLRCAGWVLAGAGFGDGCKDVPTLLDRYSPDVVFVQDVRDWLPESNISFDKSIGFDGIEELRNRGVPSFTVLKDAWSWQDMQSGLAESIAAAGILTYYHHSKIREVAEWTQRYNLLRMHHTVDSGYIRQWLDFSAPRQGAVVTGARSAPSYPLRDMVIKNFGRLGVRILRHPGYGNKGHATPAHLKEVAQYRVHVATASKWQVALRKIIESVALGCVPVTSLHPDDVLPEIDGALIRVPIDISQDDLKGVIADADARWNAEERQHWSEKALAYYDYKVTGVRNSEMMRGALCLN